MEEDLLPLEMEELKEELGPVLNEVKRKKEPPGKMKCTKRSKLEVLEDWGEKPVEDKIEIRNSLTSSNQGEESCWPARQQPVTPPSKKMKHMELNFSTFLEVEEPN